MPNRSASISRPTHRPAFIALAAAVAAACLAAPAAAQIPDPPLAGVELNLFLAGDAGHPLHVRFTQRVQRALRFEIEKDPKREDRARVVFLGDNIYPVGMPAPGAGTRRAAEAILEAQIEVVRGSRAEGWFVPGNHDWGLGAAGVRFADDFVRRSGADVDQQPDEGCPGPVVRDLGRRVSLIFIDTGWWLLQDSTAPRATGCPRRTRAAVADALREALARARREGRYAVVAAHHPLESYGQHGGKAARIQDLQHPVYRAMIETLDRAFADSPPLLFTAGHDHSLQVLRRTPIQVVSGSASETTPVRPARGADFAEQSPGFVQALFYEDGAVRVDVLRANSVGRPRRVACFWLERPAGGSPEPCADWVPLGTPVPLVEAARRR